MSDVAGAIVVAVVLLVAFPVGFLMSMSGLAALVGTVLKSDGEARNAGSELVDLNV